MSVSRKLGILVFFGVPAIIGGGITYSIFDGNYMPVLIYEIILLSIFDYRHGPDPLLTGLMCRGFFFAGKFLSFQNKSRYRHSV